MTMTSRWHKPAAGALSRLLIFLAMLVGVAASPAAAQLDPAARGLAVQAQAAVAGLRAAPTWEERILREGEPAGFNLSGSCTPGGAANPNNCGANGGVPPMVGHVMRIDNVVITASQPFAGTIGYRASTTGSLATAYPAYLKQFVVSPNAPVTLTYGRVIRPFETDGTSWLVNLSSFLSAAPATDSVRIAASFNGTLLTDDFNYSAAKTMMVAGDSIGNCTGASKTANCWGFRFRDWLKTQGYDIRIVLKTLGGSTSSDHEALRAAGYHDIGNVNLGLYELGMNDDIQSVPAATVVANMTNYWTWFHARYPATPLIVMGPGPAENNTVETNAVALRTAEATAVAAIGSAQLQFCNLGGIFDRTNTANYSTGDPTGSHIHPSDTGHAAYAATVTACFASAHIKL